MDLKKNSHDSLFEHLPSYDEVKKRLEAPIYNTGKKAITLLQESGYEAYFVGGCVRDLFLKRQAKDIDIATGAKPEQVKSVFQGYKIIETGIKHGTVTVMIDGISLEITTFRVDGTYEDYRHPSEVKFSNSIAEDLKRRDFTIGAIAFDGTIFLDPFGGITDIQKRQVRAVENPCLRFEEDPLRILRGIRFGATLGFFIEGETKRAMFEKKKGLIHIAKERVTGEINRIFESVNAPSFFSEFAEIFSLCFFEHENKKELFAKNLLPKNKKEKISLSVALALLFYKEKGVEGLLRHMKYSREVIEKTLFLTEQSKIELPDSKVEFKWLLHRVGREKVDLYFEFLSCLFSECSKEGKGQLQLIREWDKEIKEAKECYSLDSLAFRGRDFIELGFAQSSEIGRLLNMILKEVIEGRLENKKEAIVAFIKGAEN